MLTRWRDWSNWPAFSALRAPTGAAQWDTFGELRRELDRIFGDFERGQGATSDGQATAPAVRWSEDERALTVEVVLPGFSENDVELSATANTLSLRGKRETKVPEGYTVHRQERAGFEFTRSYELPTKVNPDEVEAKLKNGILTVTLPKAADVQPKRIAVKG